VHVIRHQDVRAQPSAVLRTFFPKLSEARVNIVVVQNLPRP